MDATRRIAEPSSSSSRLDWPPLSEVLKRAQGTSRFPLELRLYVLYEALQLLHRAHERCAADPRPLAVVHADVALKNVFITFEGHVKVNFGIARAALESVGDPSTFEGRLAYAAPEVVKGLPGDRRSDVFAFGVMLWEVLALRRFTPKEPSRASVEARISGFEPRILAVVPDLDADLAAICDRAMHPNPACRYPTASALQSALGRYLLSIGAIVGPRALEEAFHALFARERPSAPRIVDPRRTEATQRTVTMRNPNDEEPTTVGDLNQMLQSAMAGSPTADEPPEEPEEESSSYAPAPNRRPLVIALAALVVATVTFFVSFRLTTAANAAPSAAELEQAEPSLK